MTSGTLTMPRRPVVHPAEYEPAVSNTKLAIVIVIVGEAMLFAGMVGMYLVFRLAAPAWPPPDLPRLPIGITALNTLVLLASVIYLAGCIAVTMVRNVPLNNALATVAPGTPEAAALWTRYLSEWTLWNTVRTVAPLVSAVLLTIAVSSQSGCLSPTRFWKNDDPPAPFGKRCSSTGRPPIARSSGSSTAW